jgi:ATP synthase I chain
MTEGEADFALRRLYKLVGLFGLIGFLCYCFAAGFRAAAGFALGALCSAANLWLFDRLSRRIAPGTSTGKPWQTGAFLTRYILLLGIGYAIVKALGVSPLAVVLGLLTNAAAVLASLILELISHLRNSRTSH